MELLAVNTRHQKLFGFRSHCRLSRPTSRFYPIRDSQASLPKAEHAVSDHGGNGFGLMDWQPDALAALKKDVPFFVRPAVRKRVEAMAGAEGRSDIDLGFYQSAKQAMAPS